MITFGDRMQAIRKEAGLKQADVGRIMDVSQNLISKYETGRAEPSFNFIIRFCKHFNVTPNFLFGFSDLPITAISAPSTPYDDLSTEHRAALDAMADIFRQQEDAGTVKEA